MTFEIYNYIVHALLIFLLDPLKPHFYYISSGLRGSISYGEFSMMNFLYIGYGICLCFCENFCGFVFFVQSLQPSTYPTNKFMELFFEILLVKCCSKRRDKLTQRV